MKTILLATVAIAISAAPALASNELVILTQSELLNASSLQIEGDFNRLEIIQENTGGGSNMVSLGINGDLNGGPAGSTFSGAALAVGLAPGTIIQRGFANSIAAEVNGSGNLFAFAQIGSGNTLSASITGMNNQAAVAQYGVNNHAGFTQAGIGNTISIIQKSW